ncbi:MAG TPA: hypothetical protein VHX36_00075 [Candidatus Acidoferrales bacterium]|jgi:hypothetical protein|nr:hypothetical protein [Candidatus Acidoferrales bacterium]
MGERTEFRDLTESSFDDFVRFLFDRDIPPKSKKWNPWHFHVGVEFDARTICGYYVRMFRAPDFLSARFTKDQLEEGFWAIQGPNLDCSAYRLIFGSDLPLVDREECIHSMFDLFQRLFANLQLDTSPQMWWDSLCYDWHSGLRNRERGGEDLELHDVLFQTLARLLQVDSDICQSAALHGLGHLHHPETESLIGRFIDEHPSLTEAQRSYARAAAKFEVL